jgi:hypothetical protein
LMSGQLTDCLGSEFVVLKRRGRMSAQRK